MKTNFLILRGFCLGPEKGDAAPGETRDDIPEHLVQRLIAQAKIRPLPAASASAADTLAAARADLLDKIATAPTITDLEQLLSEDPEIVAAYEKRLAELEEAAGIIEASQIMEGFRAAQSEAEAVSLIEAAKSETALDLLKAQIPAEEAGLHAAIAARLAELDEPDH